MTPIDWARLDTRHVPAPLPRIDAPTPTFPDVDKTEPTCAEQLPEAERRKPAPEWVRGSAAGMCDHSRSQRLPLTAELRQDIEYDTRISRIEDNQ